MVDHLLVHCSWLSSLWHLSLSLMGVRWVESSSVKNLAVAWRRRMKKSWVGGICKMILLAICWCTWKERNSKIFEGKTLSLQDFKLLESHIVGVMHLMVEESSAFWIL